MPSELRVSSINVACHTELNVSSEFRLEIPCLKLIVLSQDCPLNFSHRLNSLNRPKSLRRARCVLWTSGTVPSPCMQLSLSYEHLEAVPKPLHRVQNNVRTLCTASYRCAEHSVADAVLEHCPKLLHGAHPLVVTP